MTLKKYWYRYLHWPNGILEKEESACVLDGRTGNSQVESYAGSSAPMCFTLDKESWEVVKMFHKVAFLPSLQRTIVCVATQRDVDVASTSGRNQST